MGHPSILLSTISSLSSTPSTTSSDLDLDSSSFSFNEVEGMQMVGNTKLKPDWNEQCVILCKQMDDDDAKIMSDFYGFAIR